MIIFDLACVREHRFEGWFASAEDFARQSESGMVRCPLCDSADVVRRPSAVSVHLSRNQAPTRNQTPTLEPTTDTPKAPAPASTPIEPPMLPAQLIEQMREIVRTTENVGRAFAEEARKIHYQEAPPRSIRGQASSDEAEALRDEGIEVFALPRLLSSDLQ